jgi:hypothetical protein
MVHWMKGSISFLVAIGVILDLVYFFTTIYFFITRLIPTKVFLANERAILYKLKITYHLNLTQLQECHVSNDYNK